MGSHSPTAALLAHLSNALQATLLSGAQMRGLLARAVAGTQAGGQAGGVAGAGAGGEQGRKGGAAGGGVQKGPEQGKWSRSLR